MSQPTRSVSILVNNYNYAAFLKEAIDSALSQTYPVCEVIVVDDGSTDHSREIVRAYGSRIIPVFQENGGQAAAFNTGFGKSRGDIICFLDADDIFLPHKAQQLVEIFERYDTIGWCFHALDRVDNDLKKISSAVKQQAVSEVYDLRSLLQRGKLGQAIPFDSLATSGMCFTRALLERILPMPPEIRITSDDYIKYAALGTCPGYILLERLALQRIHGNNAYTFREDKQLLRAEVLIQTAYFLRTNFSTLKEYSNNLFSLGLANFIRYRTDAQPLPLVEKYLSALSLGEWIKVQTRKNYYLYIKR